MNINFKLIISNYTDDALLELLKDNANEALQHIYTNWREGFLHWVQNGYGCNETEAVDIFQESVLGFYKSFKKGKLEDINSSLKTYFYSIGKYQALNYFNKYKKKNSIKSSEEMAKWLPDEEPVEFETEEENPVKKFLDKMQDPCKTILISFYYYEMSMANIADQLNYKSIDVVKAQKYRCMQRLKKVVQKEMKKKA